MSRDMYTFIEKKNEEGIWESIELYFKKDGGYWPVDITPENADYNLYNAIWHNDMAAARRKIPYDLGKSAYKFFDECDVRTQNTSTALFDWVELSLLAETDRALVEDDWYEPEEDEEWNPPRVNGLEKWVERIYGVLIANEIYYPDPGEVRIIAALL